jgi:hypothetical protein
MADDEYRVAYRMAFGTDHSRGSAARKGAPSARVTGTAASQAMRWTAFAALLAAVCLLLMFVPLVATWLLVDSLSGNKLRGGNDRVAQSIYSVLGNGGGRTRFAGLPSGGMKDLDRLPNRDEQEPAAEAASSVAELPLSLVTKVTPIIVKAPPRAVAEGPSSVVAEMAMPAATSVAAPPRSRPAVPAKVERPRLASIAPPQPAAAPAPPVRSTAGRLFDKVLGREPDSEHDDDAVGSISAYANPDVPRGEEIRTAVYDITGHTVYLPNGERLEAHSGLGANFDSPASYRQRMRGVTPPNVYRLTMRERLFHGVAAIRLTPVNYAAMNGRDGMLAHTYMLGPRGESNGCVSFRNYDRFLAAFRRGEITRMIVVARMTGSPASVIAAHRMPGDRFAAGRDKASER